MVYCADLGFNDTARIENIRRISEVSKLFVEAGHFGADRLYFAFLS